MNLPNKLSMARIIMVPVFMAFIMPLPILNTWGGYNSFINGWGIYISAFIFTIASITDSIDGYIARSRNLVTDFGKFLDPIADKLLVTAAVIALVQRGTLNGWFAIIIIGRELIITGFRLIVSSVTAKEQSGKGLVLAANVWGKLKMIFQTVAIIVLLLEIKFREVFSCYQSSITIGDILMFAAVIMTVVSGVIYIKENFHILKDKM